MRFLTNGMKIGHATVIVDIIQKGNPEIRPELPMVPKYSTDHDTGNAGRGANAEMHNRYIHNMASYHPRDTKHVSWHLTVDENFIYQHIPFDENAWHCGDGNGPGNRKSVGVEKCMHAGANRIKIEENAIALHQYLMGKLNIPIANVRPHQAWSGKYCPAVILNKYGSFKPFHDKIGAAFKYTTPQVASVSAKIHVVIKGDTLSRIADDNKVSIADVIKANNIKNANFIYLGQRIVIPGESKVVTPPKPTVQVGKSVKFLQKGDSGTVVKDVQLKLIKSGYDIAADGSFGPATESAVKAFQAKNKLTADGFYGPATKAKLESNLKPVVKLKEYVHLPNSAESWRTYRLNVQPIARNSDWSLTPKAFNGLEYQVLGEPYTDVVTISTSKGRRNIYVGKGTGAKLIKK